jgi:hypothetical protein
MITSKKYPVSVERNFFCKGSIEVLGESQNDANQIVENMIVGQKLNASDSRIKWEETKWMSYVDVPKTNRLTIKFPRNIKLVISYRNFSGHVKTISGNVDKVRDVLYNAGYNIINAY